MWSACRFEHNLKPLSETKPTHRPSPPPEPPPPTQRLCISYALTYLVAMHSIYSATRHSIYTFPAAAWINWTYCGLVWSFAWPLYLPPPFLRDAKHISDVLDALTTNNAHCFPSDCVAGVHCSKLESNLERSNKVSSYPPLSYINQVFIPIIASVDRTLSNLLILYSSLYYCFSGQSALVIFILGGLRSDTPQVYLVVIILPREGG